MQLPGAVTSLAADRMTSKGRRVVAPFGSFHVLHLICVAGQAGGRDLPLEPADPVLIPGASPALSWEYQVIGD